MDKKELQNYIEENIPIIGDMGFQVVEIEEDRVVVAGEYCRHINHTKSVFGGSISSVMTLACWSRMRLLMEEVDPQGIIVIKNGYTDFLSPVRGDYEVATLELEGKAMERFIRSYRRFGRGRIEVEAVLTLKGDKEILARFKGEFVALDEGRSSSS